MLTVYLIRHAESVGNLNNHLIGGQSNHFPLTPRGVAQARRLGQRLHREGYQFDQFYASPAVRAQDTARLVAEAIGFDPAHFRTDPRLLEQSQGEWEGQVRAEIYTPARRAEIAANPLHFVAPGGESQQQVADRMEAWLRDVTAAAPEGQQIAALSHGFAIKCLIARLFAIDPAQTRYLVTHNTSLTVVQGTEGVWLLDRLNDYSHIYGTEFIGHYG
ncbi:MAG: histidine phosphatase family protein [Bacteroidetes bacterium]|nr:MAG: histidine phosphatase family protein [Bacteroidota bacterium]